jgi:protein SCO1
MKSSFSRVLLLVVAVAALGLGAWTAAKLQGPSDASQPTLTSGILLTAPRPVGDFALTDQDGQPFTRRRLDGHWTLLFAGFTHCPDVCPTTLGVMKAVAERLPQDAPLEMVFLSVDPERDTPEQLKRYVRYFSPTLVGATGGADQLQALCANLGLAYMKVPGAKASGYTMDHSAALVLLDRQGRVAAYFQPPHRAETLAADLGRVLAAPS